MKHVDENDLTELALGAPAEEHQRDHLVQCEECAGRLAALARATHALQASQGLIPTPPPASVWDTIESAMQDDRADTPAGAVGAVELPVPPQRRASSEHRSDAPDPDHTHDAQGSTRPRAAWLAVAAAVGILVGAGATRATQTDPAPTTPPATATQIAATELTSSDGDAIAGQASLVQDAQELALQIRAEPSDASAGYLEVWLINSDGERMVSVGVLPADAQRHSFPISREVIDQGYLIVDISREAFDSAPEHSGDTLLRGELEQG